VQVGLINGENLLKHMVDLVKQCLRRSPSLPIKIEGVCGKRGFLEPAKFEAVEVRLDMQNYRLSRLDALKKVAAGRYDCCRRIPEA
jgi:hypothetical protein